MGNNFQLNLDLHKGQGQIIDFCLDFQIELVVKGAGGGAEGGGQQPAAARGQRGKSHGQVSRKFDIFIKNSAKHTHQSIVDEGKGGGQES